jgi:hypothetical protein
MRCHNYKHTFEKNKIFKFKYKKNINISFREHILIVFKKPTVEKAVNQPNEFNMNSRIGLDIRLKIA